MSNTSCPLKKPEIEDGVSRSPSFMSATRSRMALLFLCLAEAVGCGARMENTRTAGEASADQTPIGIENTPNQDTNHPVREYERAAKPMTFVAHNETAYQICLGQRFSGGGVTGNSFFDVLGKLPS